MLQHSRYGGEKKKRNKMTKGGNARRRTQLDWKAKDSQLYMRQGWRLSGVKQTWEIEGWWRWTSSRLAELSSLLWYCPKLFESKKTMVRTQNHKWKRILTNGRRKTRLKAGKLWDRKQELRYTYYAFSLRASVPYSVIASEPLYEGSGDAMELARWLLTPLLTE